MKGYNYSKTGGNKKKGMPAYCVPSRLRAGKGEFNQKFTPKHKWFPK